MYCTTNPKQIEAEVETARRTIETLVKIRSSHRSQAQRDAYSSARATIALYADLLDENDKVAEYRSIPDAESARLRDLWAKLDAESGYTR